MFNFVARDPGQVDVTALITQGVIASSPAGDKPQLLRELSGRAAKQLGIDSGAILEVLRSREMLGSTGVGQGIALPHARIAGLERFFGLFARLERPINFDAIDDGPVDLVFLLPIPEQAGSEHLAALAAVSRRLWQHKAAARLRSAKASSELYKILTESRTVSMAGIEPVGDKAHTTVASVSTSHRAEARKPST